MEKETMENMLANVFLRGLNPSLKKIISISAGKDFDELVKIAKRVERCEKEEQENTSIEAGIESINSIRNDKEQTKKNKVVCVICDKNNHETAKCFKLKSVKDFIKNQSKSPKPEDKEFTKSRREYPNLFCSHCNRPNHYYENCRMRLGLCVKCSKKRSSRKTLQFKLIEAKPILGVGKADKYNSQTKYYLTNNHFNQDKLKVEGETEEILIYSGAQTSFISEKYAQLRKFKRTKITKRKNWITANGSQLEVSGQTSINIMIGNTRIIGTFIISRKLAHDLIIGVDILKPNNCIVDYKSDKLICGNSQIQLRTKEPRKEKIIYTSNAIMIEPYSRQVYTTKSEINEGNLLIEKVGKLNIIETIQEAKEQIKIWVENNTPTKLVIHPHTPICKISECLVINSIKNEQEFKKFIQEGVETEKEIAKNKMNRPKDEYGLPRVQLSKNYNPNEEPTSCKERRRKNRDTKNAKLLEMKPEILKAKQERADYAEKHRVPDQDLQIINDLPEIHQKWLQERKSFNTEYNEYFSKIFFHIQAAIKSKLN
ncbi:zinc knuckle [Brachionus plicatilis]|uniref:Zinc knuckle n=1 Tax=Brachionus plicatilis TaxID=10195 RepID=A0A3M7RAD6_BRAPC|nr:zinc knuckle [Brachionus plicatilis]